MSTKDNCPFCGILAGTEPGTIVARDDERSLALIQALHPEAAVHWLAIPQHHVATTESLEQTDRTGFTNLVDFAIEQARANTTDYPQLENGFTIKFHFGSYETMPHAKLHVLSTE